MGRIGFLKRTTITNVHNDKKEKSQTMNRWHLKPYFSKVRAFLTHDLKDRKIPMCHPFTWLARIFRYVRADRTQFNLEAKIIKILNCFDKTSYRQIQNSKDYSMMWRFKNAYSELKRTTVPADKQRRRCCNPEEEGDESGGGAQKHLLKIGFIVS